MQIQQQPNSKKRQRKGALKHPSWIFWVVTGAVTTLTIGLIFVIIWLAKTQNVNQLYVTLGILASITTIVFVVPSTILAFFQWYFPHTSNNSDSSPPTQNYQEAASIIKELTTEREVISPTIWNVPFQRNPFFTGREQLLMQLHEKFVHSKPMALTQARAINGLGGIGKTQIAVEYAYRYSSQYQYVFWVKVSSREALFADFKSLAQLLQLSVTNEEDQDILIAAVKYWLASHTGWLLILDNADDLLVISDILPASSTGHILITTRMQAVGGFADSIEVEKMDEHEGILLLLCRAKAITVVTSLDQVANSDLINAKALMKEMDGLPLALDQAGAYIEETGCTIAAYLDQYKQRHISLLNRRGGLGIDHPDPVATTWSLSFEAVKQINPIAADLLSFCVFLPPDAIPEEMIMKNVNELGPNLKRISKDPFLLDDAIATLRRYSLIRRNSDSKTFSLHRLVQAVLKANMNKRTQLLWAERTVRAINKALVKVDITNWSQSQQYLSFIQACIDQINQDAMAFSKVAQLLDLPKWFQQGYRFVRAEYHYIIHEDNSRHHSQITSILLETFKDGISIFEDRYAWSGQGQEEDLQVLSAGHSLVEVIERAHWKYVRIFLGRELSKGEQAEVRIILDLYDLENKFEPYLAKTVGEQLDYLILKVVLPISNFPPHITFSERNILSPEVPSTLTQPGKINTHSGEIHWEIASPVFGHRYEIRWE